MDVTERFLRYVSYDTQSDETSDTAPSTAKQLLLAEVLRAELEELGLRRVVLDRYGRVYGHLPATPGCEERPGIGLIAHMDTAEEASGANVRPRIVDYQGGEIRLNDTTVMTPAEFPSLNRYVGCQLIVTDGTTLLGADDKAGVAEIVSAMAYLVSHPEVPHGPVAVAFTADEEIGRGAEHFDYDAFEVREAYTVDGGELGEIEDETFNAASAGVLVHGRSVHPGSAKNQMKNAALLLTEFLGLLPPAERPEHTEGREGFFHVVNLKGDCEHAMANLLVRDHDREKFEARKAYLRSVTDFLNAKYGEGTFELRCQDVYYNMKEYLAGHMDLVEKAKAAFLRAGVTPYVMAVRGGTDGARLSEEGVPCPNLSTGGVNFHGRFEYIPVESMEKMVRMLVELVRCDA